MTRRRSVRFWSCRQGKARGHAARLLETEAHDCSGLMGGRQRNRAELRPQTLQGPWASIRFPSRPAASASDELRAPLPEPARPKTRPEVRGSGGSLGEVNQAVRAADLTVVEYIDLQTVIRQDTLSFEEYLSEDSGA